MAAAEKARQLHPIVLTDRVVGADRVGQLEWALTDTIHRYFLPVGLQNCKRPVYILYNKIEHLDSLVSVGVALSAMANVQPSDFDLLCTAHINSQAIIARALNFTAQVNLVKAKEAQAICPLLCDKLMLLLEGASKPLPAFSKRWEIALPLYASMTLEDLRKDAQLIHRSLFGCDDRMPATIRKDEQRARDFMKGLESKSQNECSDAPKSAVIRELSEKFLHALIPMLTQQQYTPVQINFSALIPVTRRGGAVTRNAEKYAHGKNTRPFNSAPLAALSTGFFNGARP